MKRKGDLRNCCQKKNQEQKTTVRKRCKLVRRIRSREAKNQSVAEEKNELIRVPSPKIKRGRGKRKGEKRLPPK